MTSRPTIRRIFRESLDWWCKTGSPNRMPCNKRMHVSERTRRFLFLDHSRPPRDPDRSASLTRRVRLMQALSMVAWLAGVWLMLLALLVGVCVPGFDALRVLSPGNPITAVKVGLLMFALAKGFSLWDNSRESVQSVLARTKLRHTRMAGGPDRVFDSVWRPQRRRARVPTRVGDSWGFRRWTASTGGVLIPAVR